MMVSFCQLVLLLLVGSVSAQTDVLVPLIINAGVYRNEPYAYQDDEGAWTGLVFDLKDTIRENAKADGIDLQINVDTESGVLSDREGDAGTTNGSLDALSPDCNDTGCYDAIVGAYVRLPSRSTRVSFTTPWTTSFMTTMKHPDGRYDSISEANEGGGTVCLWEASAPSS